jgi:hypothetical protein
MRDSQGSATAIWVGIGGYDGRMQALQQVGSTAGCDRRGRQTNTVWFAVLPHPALPIPLKVRPGDILTGVVTVLPTATRLRLVNRTRGWVFERTIAAGLPDTASAEWIVEPPMNCRRYSCDQAQLANFGALTFTEIGLVADGQARTLATPALTVTPIELGWDPSGRNTPWATATPGPIDDPGTSFTITWHDATHIDRH